jgi:hypothetical protein
MPALLLAKEAEPTALLHVALHILVEEKGLVDAFDLHQASHEAVHLALEPDHTGMPNVNLAMLPRDLENAVLHAEEEVLDRKHFALLLRHLPALILGQVVLQVLQKRLGLFKEACASVDEKALDRLHLIQQRVGSIDQCNRIRRLYILKDALGICANHIHAEEPLHPKMKAAGPWRRLVPKHTASVECVEKVIGAREDRSRMDKVNDVVERHSPQVLLVNLSGGVHESRKVLESFNQLLQRQGRSVLACDELIGQGFSGESGHVVGGLWRGSRCLLKGVDLV